MMEKEEKGALTLEQFTDIVLAQVRGADFPVYREIAHTGQGT